MKILITLCLTLLSVGFLKAQDSKKVTMTITYKGTPLCYWDVTIKHGDVTIGSGTTDDKGHVDFGYVRLLSNGIDAYGYKKTPNGEKKWDVKGYIGVDESGKADFDFKTIVEDMGMGGMIESAWGLTLNDCGSGGSGGGSSSSSSSSSASSGSSSSSQSASEQQKDEMDEWEKEQEAKRAEQKAKSDEFMEHAMSDEGKAEAYQHSKATSENKITSANNKIKILQDQLAKKTPGTKEYSDLQYDIKEAEINRDLEQVDLDKTNRQIAKGNNPLNKSEKEDLVMREDLLKEELDSLKAAKKSGALYAGGTSAKSSEPKENGSSNQTESKEATKEESKEVSEDKKEKESKEEKESEEDVLKIYTEAEIAQLSVVNIKKLKLESNSKITNRKVALKTKSSVMKPEKITQYQNDIKNLEKQIELFDAELAKRKAAEGEE